MFKDLIAPISNLLGKLIPDKDKAQEATVKLAELAASGDESLVALTAAAMASQQELNKIDAQSTDKFRTRWRPSLGWVCVFGLSYEFVVRPFVVSAVNILMLYKPTAETVDGAATVITDAAALIPSLNTPQIMSLVTALLGMSTLRTYETLKGRK